VSLIGALPQPITSAPLVIVVYLVLILMIASALASVLLRDTLYSIGGFVATMLLVALLYLAIAPWQLFAVQLVLVAGVNAALLIGLLRDTTGFTTSSLGPFSREWIIGAGVGAVLLALLGGVLGATAWPVRACCSFPPDFGTTLANGYVVAIWTLAVLLGSAALGSGLALARPQRDRFHRIESAAQSQERRQPRSRR
jgi:NADH:ubiquinone oxidoreductase subunit 6 (subunit J)